MSLRPWLLSSSALSLVSSRSCCLPKRLLEWWLWSSAEYITLSGLGASRSQLIKIVLVRATLIGATGSVLAVDVAVLASPLMPVGPARQAEIHPGINIDLPVLLLGLVAMIMLVMSFSYFRARRVSRMNVDSSREAARVASPSGGTAASSSFPMVASIGIRFGLDPGRGRTGVPVLGAIITASLAVGAIAAALTFGASLHHLIDSPRQQGWNWNVFVGNPNSTTDQESRTKVLLSRNPYVSSYSAIAIVAGAGQGGIVIDGKVVDSLLAFDPLKGSVYPPLLDGHPPRGADQVVFATRTLQASTDGLGSRFT